MTQVPKVSVIVPVYKVEAFLHRCVDSVLNQSFSDFELILVDDGSPDNCGAICDEYAQKDSRVHVIHKTNGGLSDARNAGIDWAFANSDSQWLTFIDSDDWIHRDYLKLLLGAAEENHASEAVCGLYWTNEYCPDPDVSKAKAVALDAETAMVQHYGKCNSACAKIFRKELFENLRFPKGKLYEDSFVTHIPLFQAGRVAILEAQLYYYYNNPTSITHTKWTDRNLDAIEAHELRLAFLRENGYEKALLREKEIYVEELTNKITHLLDTRQGDAFADTLMLLQDKLRLALASAREDGLVPFNRENLWAYLYAMKSDWLWKAARGLQKAYRKIKYR